MGQHWLALCSVELLTPGTPTIAWLPSVSQIQVILGVTQNVSLLLLNWWFKEILHDHVFFHDSILIKLCLQVTWPLFYKLYWHVRCLLCRLVNQYTFLWGTIHLTLLIVSSRYIPPSIHLLPGYYSAVFWTCVCLWPHRWGLQWRRFLTVQYRHIMCLIHHNEGPLYHRKPIWI